MDGSLDWFLPPQQYLGNSVFSHTEIITALEALLAIASPDELQDVLVKWQSVLYSETTLITICLTVAQERVTGHTQRAVDLQDFLTMLEYTRKKGIAAAMQIVMSMANEANSQDVVPEIDGEASAIPFPRHIELLTKAITCVSREEHMGVWARLHGERGDALLEAAQEQYDQIINDFTAFLDVFTYEVMPDEWLGARGKRGIAYLAVSLSNPIRNLTLALADFDACLEKLPELDTYRTMRASLHRLRGVAHMDYNTYSNDQHHIEQAFRDYNVALEVFTRENTPFEWALTYANRGDAYRGFPIRQQAETIELAIADFNTALTVFTYQDTPEEWADTLLSRGLAYAERMHGEGVQNVEQAIADLNKVLEVYSRETNPYKYALANLNLGFAYTSRMRESRAANLATAIKFLNETVELLTPEANPLEWAAAHLSRAYAYTNYPLGERANNLELAIKDCDSALTIYTRESRPVDWAKAGLNRTLAYTYLMSDYHKQNLDYAISDYDAILEVFTRDETPRYWAIARMNRGIAYLSRSMGVEAENIERAIDDFNAALDLFDHETTFQDWVLVHINRGLAYTKRIQGSTAENIDRAIADYNAILAVLSQEQMPYFWAMTLKNRAAAYLDRVNGDSAENLQQVIADCKAAILTRTRETAPREYRDFQSMLAQIYEQQERWQDACTAIQEVRKPYRCWSRKQPPKRGDVK
jgi:tetratricopeptide (TPR) repeat protein